MNVRGLLRAGALLIGAWVTARAIRAARYTLRNKVAVITGGSRGLGLVLARHICAQGGKVAVPHLAPYSASKFALTGLSDAIRAELARDNIHVTTVAPGMMRTGSHVNARFKGKHDMEFAWFAASAGAPLISMNADRAARKILAACRRGQPSLTLTFAARGAILGNALFPNLTGYIMKLASRCLPKPSGAEGNQSRGGSEVRRLTPKWLTHLADTATARNNENKTKSL